MSGAPIRAVRATDTSREVRAGCYTCHGGDVRWRGGQAQGTAARHHDLTGHPTWTDIGMQVRYGRVVPDARQLDIEGAIAGAPAA